MARELNPPPIAVVQTSSVGVLRMWAVSDGPQQVALITQRDDPGVWGRLLVDIGWPVAEAYARRGVDCERALARIKEPFDTEWSGPTTRIKGLSDGQ